MCTGHRPNHSHGAIGSRSSVVGVWLDQQHASLFLLLPGVLVLLNDLDQGAAKRQPFRFIDHEMHDHGLHLYGLAEFSQGSNQVSSIPHVNQGVAAAAPGCGAG